MMANRSGQPKRPGDINERAKLIVEIASGEVEDGIADEGKNAEAVSLGRRGGLKGGKARAAKLTAEERREIAKRAASVRWRKGH